MSSQCLSSSTYLPAQPPSGPHTPPPTTGAFTHILSQISDEVVMISSQAEEAHFRKCVTTPRTRRSMRPQVSVFRCTRLAGAPERASLVKVQISTRRRRHAEREVTRPLQTALWKLRDGGRHGECPSRRTEHDVPPACVAFAFPPLRQGPRARL